MLIKKKSQFLAIIPARGGSKGIKNKNLHLIKKKPLIYYTIKSALNSKYLNSIVLSTDSKNIQNYVKKFSKIRIPFLRPKKLSGDKVLTLPVLKYTLLRYEKLVKKNFDFVVLLQPTSPLRISKDIDDSIKLLNDTNKSRLWGIDIQPPFWIKQSRVVWKQKYEDKLEMYRRYTSQ